jgi:hypothetical protein
MNEIRIDVDYGPPIIPHRIRGRRNADLPVGGINVLVHRHVRLTDWRIIEAITKQWVLYWPTRGRGRIVHQNDAHELSSGMAYLMPPHTTFSSDCKPGFAKWYVHFTVAGVGDALRPGVFPIRPSRRMLGLLASTLSLFPSSSKLSCVLATKLWRRPRMWPISCITIDFTNC